MYSSDSALCAGVGAPSTPITCLYSSGRTTHMAVEPVTPNTVNTTALSIHHFPLNRSNDSPADVQRRQKAPKPPENMILLICLLWCFESSC